MMQNWPLLEFSSRILKVIFNLIFAKILLNFFDFELFNFCHLFFIDSCIDLFVWEELHGYNRCRAMSNIFFNQTVSVRNKTFWRPFKSATRAIRQQKMSFEFKKLKNFQPQKRPKLKNFTCWDHKF